MFRVLMVLSICLTAGCSAYDVTRLSADAALSLVTSAIDNAIDVEEPEYRDNRDDHEDQHVFWDADVSRCIPVERRERELDRLFDAVEEGRDHVILPNGERYPVNREEYSHEGELQTPTEECIERH